MAATWRLMLSHHLAHINPTLTTGSAVAGYPVGAIRTLNPGERGRVTSASTNLQLDWDRGASAAHNAIDALCLVASPLIATSDFEVYSDTVSNFASPTKFLDDGTNALDLIVPRMCLFTTNGAGAELTSTTERYMRLAIIAAGDDTYDFGVISMGKQYELGNELLGGTESANGDGSITLTKTFRKPSKLTTANVAAIMALYEKHWIYTTDNAALDGWGPAPSESEGPRPVMLAKFSSSTATTSTSAYYGYADIRSNEWAANYSELQITMRTIPIGPIRT